ncbi:MAG: UvrD-helicase domain-containing protein [Candidatus Omnitrophota bacterium]
MTDTHPLLEQLNPDQRKAVLYFDSPLLIIAGAGSGKTKVITNKIAYLVKHKGLAPHNILGVTFTNKAAEEMRHRIELITGINARSFHISTFHSLGLRILRESGAPAGFDSEWMVMDDQDQKKIIEKIIKENFNYFTNDMRDAVRRKIGLAKMELNYPNNKEFLYQKGFNDDEVKIFSLYYTYQKENKVWDYEDMVSFPVKLLQNDEALRAKYAERFQYVVVDEFQDTNPNQYELLTLIASRHKNITVVGDDDQAVYSWRGASIRFLMDFEEDFSGAHIIKLEQNYRSTPQVLDFANNLISQNSLRRSKSMWTEGKSGNPVFILETRSKEDEASQAAELILRLKETAPEMFPLAILYRINSQSLAFETEFARRQIDFKILKGLRFFERKEIKDSLALLKLTINLNDDLSFLRVVDFLPLGIGPKSLESLSELAKTHRLSLFHTLKEHAKDKYNGREIFPAIFSLNHKVTENRGETALSDVLKRLLHVSGYLELLESKEDQSRRLNVDELMAFIQSWENANPEGSITQLMDYITLETGDKKETENTSVFLLTMHNAKGLEFPTVIAAGVNTSYLPFFMRKDRIEVEEERRLFYVASTRAIKQLVVSIGSDRRSPFLSGINRSLFSTAYSVDDIIAQVSPSLRERHARSLGNFSPDNAEERYIEHPIFGRGKIVQAIDNDKYIILFEKKGKKVIDTSIVPVTFL